MKSLYFENRLEVENAYIITVKGNDKSEIYSKRCQMSCASVEMPFKIWDAYDGTQNTIIPPEHHNSGSVMNILKITDHYLTRGEVACALSHISLWNHCALIDQPIVILEHDAIMVKKFENHLSYNSIIYLGGSEWAEQNWPITHVPPHASEGPNYHFICRAHAYSIDPTMAKNLLSHVIKFGIVAPLDIMIRCDLFNITHLGLYAYDKNMDKVYDTTIKARPEAGRTTQRNDKLEY
jgi:GR25 family glycosyltransferase involved in LPS biosynthesis